MYWRAHRYFTDSLSFKYYKNITPSLPYDRSKFLNPDAEQQKMVAMVSLADSHLLAPWKAILSQHLKLKRSINILKHQFKRGQIA